MENRLIALGDFERVEGLSKKGEKNERTHGYRQLCGDCKGKRVGGNGRGYGGMNGNRKKIQ